MNNRMNQNNPTNTSVDASVAATVDATAANDVDTNRRTVLKGTALVGGIAAVPGIASALAADVASTASTVVTSDVAMPYFAAEGVSIEFAGPQTSVIKGALARVSISNNSDTEIELRRLSPGAITTDEGVFNINSRLAKSPVAVGPNGTYHFWIRPDREAEPVKTASTGRQGMVPITVTTGKSQQVSAQHTRLAHAVLA